MKAATITLADRRAAETLLLLGTMSSSESLAFAFAAVRATEREACAQVAEQTWMCSPDFTIEKEIAKRIRARGEVGQ